MNRIQRTKHRNTRVRRTAALALLVLLVTVCLPDMQVRAESLSVRASASSVKIGDKVTVTITVPAGVSATVNLTYPGNIFSFESASETANSNGGTVSMTLGGYGGTDTATSGTITFKAKAAGSATFSASAPVAGNQEGDQVSIGGGSASVTVKNETSGGSGGGSGGSDSDDDDDDDDGGDADDADNDDGDGDERKSADNSLSSLTLSSGKLSPAFRYNVVNYTAVVDYSVTSVAVSAKVSNAKATVESVKGGENLTVGDNRIQIVVRAENGVTATYTVVVTRKAQGEAPEPDDPLDDEPDEPKDPQGKCFVVNGKNRYPAKSFPEGTAEEGFAQTEITLWEEAYPALADTFASQSLYLVWLTDENGENGDLYLLLADNLLEAYDYVRLDAERGFIVVLPDGDGNVPSAFAAMPTTLRIEGYGEVDAWFEGSGGEVALVYAVDQRGTRGWYSLETDALSYVRYREPQKPEEVQEPSTQQPEKPAENAGELERLKKQNHLIIGAAVIVALILLIIIILMLVARGGGDEEEYEYGQEEPDLFQEHGQPEEPLEKSRRKKPKKRYDKTLFDTGYLTDVFGDEEEPEDETRHGGPVGTEKAQAEEGDTLFAAVDEQLAQSVAAELDRIADPAPMQTVTTHKDQDDDDLEFIDL